jgi:hypothetical protein
MGKQLFLNGSIPQILPDLSIKLDGTIFTFLDFETNFTEQGRQPYVQPPT